ncbi:hypothetical protein DFJ73DRAFT_33569 [Zopfochytrium polystomum]|nr:hypothetical protein DFJ73DRAFT_33569 [Zopfochytrium polystomum]
MRVTSPPGMNPPTAASRLHSYPAPAVEFTLRSLQRIVTAWHARNNDKAAAAAAAGNDEEGKKKETTPSLEDYVRATETALSDPLARQWLESATVDRVASAPENYATPSFRAFLLSLDSPIPRSIMIQLLLRPFINLSGIAGDGGCAVGSGGQHNRTGIDPSDDGALASLASLLASLARLHVELDAFDRSLAGDDADPPPELPLLASLGRDAAGRPLELVQVRDLCATARVRSPEECHAPDKTTRSPRSTYALVWCRGHPFKVPLVVAHPDGASSPTHRAINAFAVWKLLTQVRRLAAALPIPATSVARLSSTLPRSQWALVKSRLLAESEAAASAFQTMQSAIVTVDLESRDAPEDLAEAIQDVRFSKHGLGRYADQTLGIVGYADGICADHAVADGGVVHELVRVLALDSIREAKDSSTGADKPLQHPDPTPIAFQPPPWLSALHPAAPPPWPENFTTHVVLRAPRGLVGKAASRGHLHGAMSLAFSRAVDPRQTVVEPCSVRHFRHGRCDPCYPQLGLAGDSRGLGETASSAAAQAWQYIDDRRAAIRDVKAGRGVGPHLAALREAAAKGAAAPEAVGEAAASAFKVLLREWERVLSGFGDGELAYLTGFVSPVAAGGGGGPVIRAGMGNLFAPGQVAAWFDFWGEGEVGCVVTVAPGGRTDAGTLDPAQKVAARLSLEFGKVFEELFPE